LAALRKARIERVTKETAVTVQINIDGTGKTSIRTGLSFIDHLVTSIGKHALIDVTLSATSNDGIVHHLAEDVAIALAQTIDKALGDRAKIARFGYALVPMDEALAYVSIDLVKRPYQKVELKLTRDSIEGVPREDLEHFARSLVQNLNACTHMIVRYGDNDHHKVEAALKAFAVALRMAAIKDNRRKGAPSTKGAM
jgi:imidazoleglycerol-phosphate dehydratase